jgi:hypothetical protein
MLSYWHSGTRTRCCAAIPVRYDPADRVWFAALARLLPRDRWTEVFPVTPATLLTWHRKLAAGKYDTSNLRKPGRPPTVPSIARIIVRLGNENPLYVKPGIMWSRRAMPPSGRGVCESGCQQDRRMRAPHNFSVLTGLRAIG